MMTILLVAGCVAGVLFLVLLGVGIFVVMQAGQRDSVSTAREGWIHRRSKKDTQGW